MAKKSGTAHQVEVAGTEVEESTTQVESAANVESTTTAQVEELSLDDQLKLPEEALIARYGNKSKAIRGLALLGAKAGPISRALKIRFQHARNVMNKPLKRLIAEERKAAQEASSAVAE